MRKHCGIILLTVYVAVLVAGVVIKTVWEPFWFSELGDNEIPGSGNYWAEFNLGNAHERKGRYQEALDWYNISIRHHPWYTHPYLRNIPNTIDPPWRQHGNIGGVLMRINEQLPLAEAHLRLALSMKPNSAVIKRNLRLLAQMKRWTL